MSRKKAALLTVNSFTALTKVCSSRHSLVSLIKPLNFAYNFSTASERSDFESSNGFNYENSSDYPQKHSRVFGEDQKDIEAYGENCAGSPNFRNLYEKNGDFDGGLKESCRNEFFPQNHMSDLQNRNANENSGHRPWQKSPVVSHGIENRQNLDWKNGNSTGYDGENLRSYSCDRNPSGHSVSYDEVHGGNRFRVPPNPNMVDAENSAGLRNSLSGYHGEDRNSPRLYGTHSLGVAEVPQHFDYLCQQGDSGSQENVNRSYGANTGGSQPSINGHYAGNGMMYSQSPDNPQMGNTGMHRQSPGYYNTGYSNNSYQHDGLTSQETVSGDYGGNVGHFQPSPHNQYTGINRLYEQDTSDYNTGSAGTHWQSPSYFDARNSAAFQQSPGKYQNGNFGAYQQISSNHHTGDSGLCQPSQSGYHQENFDGFQSSMNGNYHENKRAYQAIASGHYTHNSNESQNNIVAFEESTCATHDGESAEGNHYCGTLEELESFCKEEKVKEAVEILGLLEKQGISVDLMWYLLLMKTCGEAKDLDEAKTIHQHLVRSICPLQVSTYNRILEMYAKCGSMDDACNVFNEMPTRNLTSWDIMITWLAKNGLGEDAIDMFSRFKEAGLKPDGPMFIGVFSACGVLGDVVEGLLHFDSMSNVYGIVPTMEHYVSIVDMLGSTGHLDEALEFIERMPLEPSIEVWETLMNLCRVQGRAELGDRCAGIVEQLDPSRLNKESKAGLVPIRAVDISKEKEKKKAGQSPLEVKSRVHEYRAGDRSHPENEKLYALLRGMKEQMKEAGYVPETRFVLHDIDQEGKEEALMAHSERLATAYGLLTSPARSPIRVIKNLRVVAFKNNVCKLKREKLLVIR
ncbi:hypothetical protein Nepgr_008852 [Nepenthes gracilis]|uniref:DYW domain-containing protein n=1 Tax=Nepenthes gracilis TaxID=150966 RepID=A0AAD3S9Q1_NEPGR|nr:hypothetical protein Nepgr_008852 [Nepenthes gracilis]